MDMSIKTRRSGPLSRYASDDDYGLISKLELALGIEGANVQSRELAQIIIELTQPEYSSRNLPCFKFRTSCHEALNRSLENPHWPESLFAESDVLKGNRKAHPTPSFLLHDVDHLSPELQLSLTGLKQLILSAVLSSMNSSKSPIDLLNKSSYFLRQSTLSTEKARPFLKNLPPFREISSYLATLSALIQDTSNHFTPTMISHLTNTLKAIWSPRYENQVLNNNWPLVDDNEIKYFHTPTKHAEDEKLVLAIQGFFENVDLDEISQTELTSLINGVTQASSPDKHWVSRFQTITKAHKSVFTNYEKLNFAKYLREQLSTNDLKIKLAALTVNLMYFTGNLFDSIMNFKIADDGNLTVDGIYQRKIKRPDNAFVPDSKQLTDYIIPSPIIKFQLPGYITLALKELFAHTTGTTFESRLKEVLNGQHVSKELVSTFVSGFRMTGGFERVTLSRIPNAFTLESALLFCDPLMTHFLVGRINQEPPVLSYYATYPLSEIQNAYKKVTSVLLGDNLPSEKDHILPIHSYEEVSNYYPALETLTKFVLDIKNRISNIQDPNDFIERHNRYTDYCLTLLFISTAHRPVEDPFPTRHQINLESRLLLINDKVVTEGREWRIVPLTELAKLQLDEYFSYLEKLAFRLVIAFGHNTISNRIIQTLENDEASIPLFFYLDESSDCVLSYNSATPSILEDRLSQIWPFPLNYMRHICATELRHRSKNAVLTELVLGHNNSHSYPFGSFSSVSLMETFDAARPTIDAIIEQLGFSVIRAPMRLPKNLNDTHIISETPSETSVVLGYQRREKSRLERKQSSFDIVKEEINTFLTIDKFVQGTTFSDRAVMLRNQIFELAQEHGLGVNSCFVHCIEILRKKKKLKLAQALTPLIPLQVLGEPSPFTEGTLANYAQLNKARRKFIDYLDHRSKRLKPLRAEEYIALIMISSSLFSYMSQRFHIEKIKSSLSKMLFQYQGDIFIELPINENNPEKLLRIKPDPISAQFIIGFAKLSPARCNNQRIDIVLEHVQSEIGLKSDLSELTEVAYTAALIELPGALLAVISGEIESVSIPQRSFARLRFDKALAHEHSDVWQKSKQKQVKFSLQKEGHGGLKDLKKALRNHSKEIEFRQVPGRQKERIWRKKPLFQKLSEELKSGKWKQLPQLILGFAMHLCKNKTRFDNDVGFDTVDTYTFLILNAFIYHSNDENLLELDADEFEELYIHIVQSTPKKQQFSLASRLIEFHEFLVDACAVDPVEHSTVFSATGCTHPKINTDANIISPREYSDMLELINNDDRYTRLQQLQNAAMFIFGYRFGLRFQEALKLKFKNLQIHRSEVAVFIEQTKTKAGSRKVIADEELTDMEMNILCQLQSILEQYSEREPLLPLMTSINPKNYRELIPCTEVAQYLNSLLKSFTGDFDLRFHHLRHSYISRKLLSVWSVQNNLCIKDPLSALVEISTSAGHVGAITTITSYFHFAGEAVAYFYGNWNEYLTASAQALCLSDTSLNITQRKYKNKKTGMHKDYIENIAQKHIKAPTVQFQESRYAKVKSKSEIPKNSEITLRDIDLILQNHKRIVNGEFPLSYITQDVVNNVIEIGQNIELESSYARYDLLFQRKSDLFIKAKTFKNSDVPFYETEQKRIEEHLDIIQSKFQSDNTAPRNLRRCLEVWCKSYDHISRSNIVTGYEEVQFLMQLYSWITPNKGAVVIIEEGFELIDEIQSELVKANFEVKKGTPKQSQSAKFRQEKENSIQIKPKNKLGPSSPREFHRLAFITHIKVKNQ